MEKRRFLWNDLKEAICNGGFFLGMGALLWLLLRAELGNSRLDHSVSTYEIIINAMAISGFTPFAAIFPVLGYSSRFCTEYRSGYFEMMLSRMSWKSYGRTRILTTAVSGGALVGIPFTIVMIIAYCGGIHGMPTTGLYQGTRMEEYLLKYGDSFLLAGKVILGILFGALWALVGLAFAVWSKNKYVVMVAPFVLYEMMWILLSGIPILNPIYLIRGDDINSYPLSALMQIIYMVIVIIIIWRGLKKRAYDE